MNEDHKCDHCSEILRLINKKKIKRVKQIRKNIKRGFQIGFFVFVAGACIIGAILH